MSKATGERKSHESGGGSAAKLLRHPRHIWRRCTRPFRVRVYTYERVRIRVRSFPPLFEWAWRESLRERVAKGGRVAVEPGLHFLSESIVLRENTTLIGAALSGPTMDGSPLVRIPWNTEPESNG